MPQFSITSEINVEALRPDADNFFILLTGPADLNGLADRFGWVSVKHLASELVVRKVTRDCWDVSGYVAGQIIQNCIVTGAPLLENIDFHIEERYVRSAKHAEHVELALNDVEPIKNGVIDIGELVVQSLCLAAAAWPRVNDAPNEYSFGEQELDHPFAALSELRRKNRE